MSKYGHPDAEIILQIATEMGVHSSFIEKDWYAVQILKLISERDSSNICPIFSGGTSLSKGFGLIQRFSEDLDFKIASDEPRTRAQRREYRTTIIRLISAQNFFDVMPMNIGSRFFELDIAYPQSQELDDALRANLKIEMRFQDEPVLAEKRPISSFIGQFTGADPEVQIDCVAPAETATDKFSALLWRIQVRDRSQELTWNKNDPTMIRHLHDLCALEQIVLSDQNCKTAIQNSYQTDRGRGGSNPELTLEGAINIATILLEKEEDYRREYEQFVAGMSYAPDDKHISFDRALASFKNIAQVLID